ncbi:MAG TPA: hypothetical protein PKH77_23980 [Anaerolineae bacterium]|nr:hypothetical protein [Anaerolineae bacterium]
MDSITIAEREFVIQEPNALHLVRILRVVGKVGTQAEKAAQELGKKVLSSLKEDSGNLSGTVFLFLAALGEEDLLELMAALLQFEDGQEGVKWLKKHPPTINQVVQAVGLNLAHTESLTEAIQNFTQIVSSLRLAGKGEEAG